MVVEWLKNLFDAIFPERCAVCGGALEQGEETICTSCRWDMPLTDYWSAHENFVVERLAGRVPFEQASALMFFRRDSDYRRLIHRMKYGARRDVAVVLGEIYGRYLAQSELYRDVEIIVPVPLHFTKLIKRGYNQSEFFARGIARSMGVAVEAKAVRRVRRTQTQARLKGSAERVRNVQGAFVVIRADRLSGRVVLVVDDVLTTGATIEATALAIIEACPDVRLSLGAIAIVR